MTLGINGIRLVGKRSGVARCIEAVLNCLADMDHPFRELRVYSPKPIESGVTLPASVKCIVAPSSLPPALWEQITLLKAHGDRDVLFCPSYVIPFLAKCPTIVTHHGSYEGYPKAFNWWTLNKARFAYSMSARRATVVSTVSEYSKRDMVRYYGISPDRIHVVPEGVYTAVFRPIKDQRLLTEWRTRTFGADVQYIVYVGKPTERRNLSSLIRAFARLKRDIKLPHKLLIAGADLPGTSPFRRVIAEERVDSDVIVRGYVEHDEMPLVYNAADLLVYPSSYEGFGMPVLEAMACGTPVIALNNTAFPEFAGGIAHLLPDAKAETLADGIRAVLSDGAWRERMRRDGPVRAAAYDWRRITALYLQLMLPLIRACRAAHP
jgi:glycosyltransferase involved in cell wall biosynthesis